MAKKATVQGQLMPVSHQAIKELPGPRLFHVSCSWVSDGGMTTFDHDAGVFPTQ